MKTRSRVILKTYPSLTMLLMCVLALAVTLLLHAWQDAGERVYRRHNIAYVGYLFALLWFILGSIHHTLMEDHLLIHFLFIPIRRVRWEAVAGGIYRRNPKGSNLLMRNQVTFVLKPYEIPSDIEMYSQKNVDEFVRDCVFQTVSVILPYKQGRSCAEMIGKYVKPIYYP